VKVTNSQTIWYGQWRRHLFWLFPVYVSSAIRC